MTRRRDRRKSIPARVRLFRVASIASRNCPPKRSYAEHAAALLTAGQSVVDFQAVRHFAIPLAQLESRDGSPANRDGLPCGKSAVHRRPDFGQQGNVSGDLRRPINSHAPRITQECVIAIWLIAIVLDCYFAMNQSADAVEWRSADRRQFVSTSRRNHRKYSIACVPAWNRRGSARASGSPGKPWQTLAANAPARLTWFDPRPHALAWNASAVR